jgi:hypothetical protein
LKKAERVRIIPKDHYEIDNKSIKQLLESSKEFTQGMFSAFFTLGD